MGITTMVKNIKEIHPKTLLLFKVGAFCESFGRDSYIISYLFNYQVRQKANGKEEISNSGFSRKAIPRVLAKLEEQKIDYMLIDVRNDYAVDEKVENKNLNSYDDIFEKSRKYVNKQRRIKEISDKIEQQMDLPNFKDKLKRIEGILNETGTI